MILYYAYYIFKSNQVIFVVIVSHMCYQIHWVSRFISTSAIIVTMDSKRNTCLYLICSPMNPMTAYAASAKNIFHRSARFFVTWLLMVTPSVQPVTKSSTKKIVQEIVLKVQTLKLSFCVGCRLQAALRPIQSTSPKFIVWKEEWHICDNVWSVTKSLW